MMFTATRLLAITLLAGTFVWVLATPTPSSGSLMFRLTGSDGRALENTAVSFRLARPDPPGGIISGTSRTDRTGNLMIENIPASGYMVQLEAIGFDDYSGNRIIVVSGQVTTVEVSLEPVQELPFTRLAEEKIQDLVRRCNRTSRPVQRMPFNYVVFSDAQSWKKLWKEYGVIAPHIDFRKHRVAAVIQDQHGPASYTRIRRIVYNPKRRRTLVRLGGSTANFSGDVQSAVMECDADFVLFPAGPGDVAFR